MKLRSKILLSLVSVGVIPLMCSLLIVGDKASSETQKTIEMRAQDAANFIAVATGKISTENLTLVQLLSSNPFLVNGIYSAFEHTSRRQWLKELGVKMVFIDPFKQDIQVMGNRHQGKFAFDLFYAT